MEPKTRTHKMRISILSRKFHRWGAIAIGLPLALVIGSGLLLQVKKQFPWVQPHEHRTDVPVPAMSWETILAAAKSVPDANEWMDPGEWPALDWETLGRHHALQLPEIDRVAPPGEAKSFDEWRATTQAYQAALLQLQIEDLRRVKYSPTGGFAQFSFADVLGRRSRIGVPLTWGAERRVAVELERKFQRGPVS